VVGLDVELVEDFEPQEIGDRCAHRAFDAGRGGGDEFVVGGLDDFGDGLADLDGETAEVVAFGHPERIAGGAGAVVDGGQAEAVRLVGGEEVFFLFLRRGRGRADREIGVPRGIGAFFSAIGREGDSPLFSGGRAGFACQVGFAGKKATVPVIDGKRTTVSGGDARFDLFFVVELGEGFPVAHLGGEGDGVGGVEGGALRAGGGGGHERLLGE
jgi:hypothetical protein